MRRLTAVRVASFATLIHVLLCARLELHQHCTGFESAASCCWATRAWCQGQDLHLQHTGSGPASSAGWDTLAWSPRRGSNSPRPGRQPGVLTRGQREEKEEPPARFELANPAFGGLGPFLLAAARVRSAGFEPAGAALEGRLPIQLGTSA
jgi:hypothetical protein